MPLSIPPVYQCPSHPLSSPNDCPSTPVGDAVSNLVSFNTKSLQYLPRSLLSLAPLAVLSPVYAATGTALSSTLIYTGLVEPRRLLAANVVLNHRISHISCSTALYQTLCVGPFSATPPLFWTSGPVRGESPNYWDSAELIRAPIPRNGSGKTTTTTTMITEVIKTFVMVKCGGCVLQHLLIDACVIPFLMLIFVLLCLKWFLSV